MFTLSTSDVTGTMVSVQSETLATSALQVGRWMVNIILNVFA